MSSPPASESAEKLPDAVAEGAGGEGSPAAAAEAELGAVPAGESVADEVVATSGSFVVAAAGDVDAPSSPSAKAHGTGMVVDAAGADGELAATSHEANAAPAASKSKARAEELSLQLEGVPPPAARGIEIEAGSGTRSRRPTVSRPFTPSAIHAPDSPTTSLISSLREQLQILSLQSEQLNTKLIASIGKHADLEDQIFTLSTQKEEQAVSIEELERAKAQWEESMNTGLLVERSAIREEMQRLAAGLVEEERKRGSAEERREQVESEVDNLTATLFEQANTMVATERMSRALAEDRLRETEENLAAAEAAMRDMQQHLQSLPADGSGAAASSPAAPPIPRRFLSSHPPFNEFQVLISHLRAMRPSARARASHRELYPAPLVSTLLAQPFLARCVAEDHEPTLRLEQAADLGWVSRRSVGAAVISGDLLIEPIAAATLGPLETISCALCGRGIFSPKDHANPRSLLKLFASPGNTPAPSSTSASVYVFRVATGAEKDAKAYPLCRNGWCLERLRAACALWHFVRTGIVHPIWNGEDGGDAADTVPGEQGTPVQIDMNSEAPDADKLTVSPAGVVRQPAMRSASAPNTAAVVAGPGAKGIAEATATAPPGEPTRRKSAWGLGSFKQPSWGWSRPTTPSPGIGAVEKEREEREREKAKLGAPIDLEGREGVNGKTGEEEEATVTEVKEGAAEIAVEEGEKSEIEIAAAAVGEKGTLEVPSADLARSASRTSATTSEDGSSFATPSGDHLSLAEEGKVEEGGDQVAGDLDSDSTGTEGKGAEGTEPEAVESKAEGEKGDEVEDSGDIKRTISDEVKETNSDEDKVADSDEAAGAKTDEVEATDESKDKADSQEAEAKSSDGKAEEKDSESDTAKSESGPIVADKVDAEEATTADAGSAAKDAPATSATNSPVPPPRAGGRAAPPPPLPPRSAARGATPPITPTVAASGMATTPRDGNATPTAAQPPRPPPRRSVDSPRRSVDAPRRSVDAPRSSAELLPPPHRTAPSTPGPAARPQRTVAPPDASEEHDVRAFIAGDGWEIRTWKQIIKLKEDMWRARVGVVDE